MDEAVGNVGGELDGLVLYFGASNVHGVDADVALGFGRVAVRNLKSCAVESFEAGGLGWVEGGVTEAFVMVKLGVEDPSGGRKMSWPSFTTETE